jgi:phospholipid transport system substrate-binding protein
MRYTFKKKPLAIPAAFTAMVVVFLLALLPRQACAQQTPEQTIKTFNAALLEAMKKADELGYKGRYALLAPVIDNSFALSFMGDLSLGRYRKTLSEQQHRSYLKTYSEWTIGTYAGRFDGYSGERFEVVSESKPDRGIVNVISKLVKANGEEVEFDYLLRSIGGKWRVVDIHMSGVSQLALTRSQFTSIVKDKGFDGLMAMLKEKIEGFSKGRGK